MSSAPADAVMERVRGWHSDVEKWELEIQAEMARNLVTQKQKVMHETFIADRLAWITEAEAQLLSFYNSEFIDDLLGEDEVPLADANAEFYDRLKDIYSTDHSTVGQSLKEEETLARLTANSKVADFTGEEHYGRFLDLHFHFNEYKNLPHIMHPEAKNQPPAKKQKGENGRAIPKMKESEISYELYLKTCLDKFDLVAEPYKNGAYLTYLNGVKGYLSGFIQRCSPLMVDVKELADKEVEATAGPEAGPSLPPEAGKKKKATKKERQEAFKQKVRLAEAYVAKYLEILQDVREATVANLDAQASRTPAEKLRAIEQEEEDTRKSFELAPQTSDKAPMDLDELDEPTISNPMDLPMGWDNKPIPYWLYKLHGLGINYKCDICGVSYRGPRAFERHFSEAKHSSKMRGLGIPNTRHFMYVTTVADARALWDKITYDAKTNSWDEERDMEYEDRQGQVFNKRTYNDLRRAGHI